MINKFILNWKQMDPISQSAKKKTKSGLFFPRSLIIIEAHHALHHWKGMQYGCSCTCTTHQTGKFRYLNPLLSFYTHQWLSRALKLWVGLACRWNSLSHGYGRFICLVWHSVPVISFYSNRWFPCLLLVHKRGLDYCFFTSKSLLYFSLVWLSVFFSAFLFLGKHMRQYLFITKHNFLINCFIGVRGVRLPFLRYDLTCRPLLVAFDLSVNPD